VKKEDLRWCNPSFLVPKPGGEWRKVVDCRRLNAYMKDKRFKMENLETALKMARKGDYATKIDITSAYNHVPVQENFRSYLGFSFAGAYYTYLTMPFGFKNAPRIFTKLMRPVIWHIRKHWKARVVVYMDDILMLFDDVSTATTTTHQVMNWMQSLGWKLSMAKCQTQPQQQVTFLGWVLDLKMLQLRMTKQRRRRLMEDLQTAKRWSSNRKRVRVRWLATLIGRLNFLRAQATDALLHLTRMIRTKNAAVKREGWKGGVRLTPFLLGEIKWWLWTIKLNKPHTWANRNPSATLTTDASPWGWGATLERTGQPTVFAWGEWEDRTRGTTSNLKELLAVLRGFRSLSEYLEKGSCLKIKSDNTSAVYNVQRWKGRGARQDILRRLRLATDRAHITIEAEYLPGVQNEEADRLSRMGGSAEYYMTMKTREKIWRQWKLSLTLDAFATRETRLLPRYATKAPGDPGATAVDGLKVSWEGEVVLAHPPPILIQECLCKAMEEPCLVVLITPDWQGQSWSSQLEKMSIATIHLGQYRETMIKSRRMTMTGRELPPGEVRADLLDTRTIQEMQCSDD
jgi:hypothetical protein